MSPSPALEAVSPTWLSTKLAFDSIGQQLGDLCLEDNQQRETASAELGVEEDTPSLYSDDGTSVYSFSLFTPPASPQRSRLHTGPSRLQRSSSSIGCNSTIASINSAAPLDHQNLKLDRNVSNRAKRVEFESPSLPDTPYRVPSLSLGSELASIWSSSPSNPSGTGNVLHVKPQEANHGRDAEFEKTQELLYKGLAQRAMSQPIVTHYVRVDGLDGSLTRDELRRFFSPIYGVQDIYWGLLRRHRVVIVSFFDARMAFSSTAVIPRLSTESKLSAFCITRQAAVELGDGFNNFLSTSEGILVVSIRGPLSISPVPLFGSFGPIRHLRVIDASTYVVEFWDSRHAEIAASVLEVDTYSGCQLICSFEPSIASTSLQQGADSPHTQKISQPASSPSTPTFVPVSLPTARFEANFKTLPRVPSKPSITFRERLRGLSAQEEELSQVPASPVNSQDSSRSFHPAPTNREDYGKYRDEKIQQHNIIFLDRIEQGLEVRQTLMLKNIPNRATALDVMRFIDEAVGRAYDFFYLRIDFSNNCNVGYAFVNFTSSAKLVQFVKARQGTRWNMYQSDKLCYLTFADTQGKENLVNRFKNSAVMLEQEAFRPKLFYTSGPFAGQPEPFPEPDDPFRIARSAANVSSVGLFPSTKPVFKVTRALRGVQT